jgi:Uri superfamily endonuclease
MQGSLQGFDSLIIPVSPGVYILDLEFPQPLFLQIGKLGEFDFPVGQYLYVGSAQGPGGLRARLGRHLLGSGRRRWHIDWLMQVTLIKGFYFLATGEQLECSWCQTLLHLQGAEIPAPGFGASDCRNKPAPCAAHLLYYENSHDQNFIRKYLPADDGSQVVYQKFSSQFLPDHGDIE